MSLAHQILLLNQIINEVYFGNLYHSTSLAIPILQQNMIGAVYPSELDPYSHGHGVSFTRSPLYWFEHETKPVRFILDGTKISHNYRLIPIDNAGSHGLGESESELYIRESLKNLRRYLLGVEINARGFFGGKESKTLQKVVKLSEPFPVYVHEYLKPHEKYSSQVHVQSPEYIFRKGHRQRSDYATCVR